MTTDQLVSELIDEIRRDREARKTLEAQVSNCTIVVAALAKDLADFRKLVFEGERSLMERIRRVSDFSGMTDPHDGNGGG